MSSKAVSDNENRQHAVQQLKKGIHKIPKTVEGEVESETVAELHIAAATANALIALTDEIHAFRMKLENNNHPVGIIEPKMDSSELSDVDKFIEGGHDMTGEGASDGE